MLHPMGFKPEQVIGKELKGFLPENISEEKNKFYVKAWEGKEKVTYEEEINGVYYLASLSPIRKNGRVVEVIGSCVDITEQKRIVDELKLKNLKYELIAENMNDLIIMTDKKGRILYVSSSFERILGFPTKKCKGHSVFKFIHSDDIDIIRLKSFSNVALEIPTQIKFRHRHANGG